VSRFGTTCAKDYSQAFKGLVLIEATTANSSRKTGLAPRSNSSSTGSTILVGPPGVSGFTGDSAFGLSDP
jgi:hypothetical protein